MVIICTREGGEERRGRERVSMGSTSVRLVILRTDHSDPLRLRADLSQTPGDCYIPGGKKKKEDESSDRTGAKTCKHAQPPTELLRLSHPFSAFPPSFSRKRGEEKHPQILVKGQQ